MPRSSCGDRELTRRDAIWSPRAFPSRELQNRENVLPICGIQAFLKDVQDLNESGGAVDETRRIA